MNSKLLYRATCTCEYIQQSYKVISLQILQNQNFLNVLWLSVFLSVCPLHCYNYIGQLKQTTQHILIFWWCSLCILYTITIMTSISCCHPLWRPFPRSKYMYLFKIWQVLGSFIVLLLWKLITLSNEVSRWTLFGSGSLNRTMFSWRKSV